MHKVAAEKINEGLSLPARIILFIFSCLSGAIMFLTAPDNEKAIYVYAFGVFCFSIGIACLTTGRVRQFVGSLIALAIVLIALWYLYSEFTAGVWFSGRRSQPSILNAILFSFAFGLPSILYIFKAKFGLQREILNKSLQPRSGTSCLRWTVFKSQFYGFAAQKFPIKPQLKNCR